MRAQRSQNSAKSLYFMILVLAIFGACSCTLASTPDILHTQRTLQLEVIINDIPTNIVSQFVQFPNGSFGITQRELEDLGLHTGLAKATDELVMLTDIPSLTYEFLERTQQIRLKIDNRYRTGQIFDLTKSLNPGGVRPNAGFGTVFNYDFLGSTNFGGRNAGIGAQLGTSLTVDARAFSPYGTVSQSGIATDSQSLNTQLIRLDTAYRYSDPDRLVSYSAGDTINGGLAWTRPIRVGGLQLERDFSLRPDLVTMPLPTLGGTAAVPSTVDVYVNNIKTFTQDVNPGPFSLTNIPVVTGAGNAELVVRNSSGQETRTSQPFFASSNLLQPGLSSWSVEAGLPRLYYGSSADTYDNRPVISGTLRGGIFDGLTLESHAEGGSGVANGGFGAVVKTGTVGVLSGAVASSVYQGRIGVQLYGAYELRLGEATINASTQRSIGDYEDLASATARLNPTSLITAISPVAASSYVSLGNTVSGSTLYEAARAPVALDRISFNLPMPFDSRAGVSLGFTRLAQVSTGISDLATFSYTRPILKNGSLYATLFHDFGSTKTTGVVVGFSMPLGEAISASTSISSGSGGMSVRSDASKSLGTEAGDFGWQVQDSEGAVPYRQGSVSYRSGYGVISAGAGESSTNSFGTFELRGSIVTMSGHAFVADRIDDAFAVVDAGAPNIQVLSENRPVGYSNADGLLLVPSLRAYQKNTLSIDPTNLPADSEIESTREIVAPADRAGMLVTFKVRHDRTAARVTFLRADKSVVPVGSNGKTDSGEDFIIGYDGEAFLKLLKSENDVTVDMGDSTCHAHFNFQPVSGQPAVIQAVICK